METGAHLSHINNSSEIGDNFGCVDCHSGTVSGDTTISSPATHLDLDGTPDVAGTNVGTYSSGNCNSSYCHSSGQETTVNRSVNWTGGALDCKGCHGTTSSTSGEPDYGNGYPDDNTANSHLVHDRASTADCNKCHSGTVNGSGNIFSGSAHLDGARDVAGAGIGGYNEGTEECSNVNCHSSDGAGGTANDSTPQWGDDTWAGPACTFCHNSNAGAAPTYDMETGAHLSHINNGHDHQLAGHPPRPGRHT
jgi:predicted CxxxxCH...CXXCH cytochrome family protein